MPSKRRSPLEARPRHASIAPLEETKATNGRDASGSRDSGETAVTRPASLEDLADYYQNAYGHLHRQAMRMVHSSDIAHDVVHEAFAVTVEKIQAGVEIEHLGAWLSTVIRNRCTHLWRAPALVPLGEHEPDSIREDAPAEIAAARHECRDIYRTVAELSPSQRAAFLMAEVRGLTYGEIAESMGRSYNSVRQLLARARRQVREAVGNDLCLIAAFFALDRLAALLRHPAEQAFQPAMALVAATVAVGAAGGLGPGAPGSGNRPTESLATASLEGGHSAGRALAAGLRKRSPSSDSPRSGAWQGTSTAGFLNPGQPVGGRASAVPVSTPTDSGSSDEGGEPSKEKRQFAQVVSAGGENTDGSDGNTALPTGTTYAGGPGASIPAGPDLPDLDPRPVAPGLSADLGADATVAEGGNDEPSPESASNDEAGAQGNAGTDTGTDPGSNEKPPPESSPPPPPPPCRRAPVDRFNATRRC